MPKLYLIDGHALVFKYYHAFRERPLVNSLGEITSASYGLAKVLSTLMRHYDMTHIGVIFDPPGGGFRKKIYPQYKATRQKTPDDIRPLLARAYQIVKTWGVYTSAFDGWEADDVIGTLAKKAEAEGFEVFIVTRDKDFAQLVSNNVCLLDLGQKIGEDSVTYIKRDEVFSKYGVWPEQIVDWLTMIGDTSDNIDGIDGIGKKLAPELLIKYGSLANIYGHLNDLTPKKQEGFLKAQEHIPLLKKLCTIVTDIDLPITLDVFKKPALKNHELILLLKELELHSIIADLAD